MDQLSVVVSGVFSGVSHVVSMNNNIDLYNIPVRWVYLWSLEGKASTHMFTTTNRSSLTSAFYSWFFHLSCVCLNNSWNSFEVKIQARFAPCFLRILCQVLSEGTVNFFLSKHYILILISALFIFQVSCLQFMEHCLVYISCTEWCHIYSVSFFT